MNGTNIKLSGTRVAKQRQELQMVRRFRKAVILLIALGLIAPMSARAGSRYHRSHGHSSHRVHLGHHSYYGYHSYYGSHGYYNYYSPRFYGPDGNLYRGVGYVENIGALDLNVKPKKTQVYLNGNYIGITDRFDGFPGYLWLKEGTYELVFYNEGYMTMVQNFAIHPGAVIDVKVRLVPGKPVPPEKLLSKTTLGDESR